MGVDVTGFISLKIQLVPEEYELKTRDLNMIL
jgi:hypothetical protein